MSLTNFLSNLFSFQPKIDIFQMANISTTRNETERNQTEVLGVPTKVFLYVILLVMSLLGNTLVVVVILRTKNLRTHFNYLIVNMSISDFVVPLVAMPLRIVQETSLRRREWLVDGALGNALCKLLLFFTDISPAVSVLTLVLIAVNRFLVTWFPIKRQIFSHKTNKILIVLVWLMAMMFFSPYFYTFRLEILQGYPQCVFLWSPAFDDKLAHSIFTTLYIVLFFFLPFIIISFLYTLVMLKLHKNSVDMKEMLNHNQLVSRREKNKKIIVMSIIIIVTFGLFWGPYYMYLFLGNFIWQWDFPPEVKANLPIIGFAVQYAGFFNSVINPWIYFIFLRSYRRGLKRLFFKRCNNSNHVRQNTFGSSTAKLSTSARLRNGVMDGEACKSSKYASTRV